MKLILRTVGEASMWKPIITTRLNNHCVPIPTVGLIHITSCNRNYCLGQSQIITTLSSRKNNFQGVDTRIKMINSQIILGYCPLFRGECQVQWNREESVIWRVAAIERA